MLKRKLAHSNTDVVFLALNLSETLVKNGGESLYLAINNEGLFHFYYHPYPAMK